MGKLPGIVLILNFFHGFAVLHSDVVVVVYPGINQSRSKLICREFKVTILTKRLCFTQSNLSKCQNVCSVQYFERWWFPYF